MQLHYRWNDPVLSAVAILQGIYYLATAIWSLVDIESFQRVTGRKTDLWLVKTVGVLVASISLPLFLAAYQGDVSWPVVSLAIGSAIGLAAIDVYYTARGVISKIYLVDAVGEVVLIVLWIVALLLDR